ncbi:GRAM [Penicillium digitatum]|uniref:GRAM n=1 Tax=Penicillium digitatum TaxID=36651 RepID=A0A7T6XL37_PENDI|nr:GRAM [Penicillium digitatum]
MADSSSSSVRGENRSRRSWTLTAESSALESNGRSSQDSNLERPKTQSGEADPKAGPSGFSKLLDVRRRRKESKKKNQKPNDESGVPTVVLENDLHESRSDQSRDGTSAAPSSNGESFAPEAEGDNNCLLTDDEEPDGPPPLTSHSSHAGFYTSSSPMFKTRSVDAANTEDSHADAESALSGPSAPGSELIPGERISRRATSGMALDIPADPDSKKRGTSPGRLFKGAFGSDKKSANDDPEASSVKPGGTKSGRGLFGAGRRSSLSVKRALVAPDDDPSVFAPIRTDLTDDKARSLEASPMPNTPPHSAIPAPATTVTPPTPTEYRLPRAHILSNNAIDSPESLQSGDSPSSGITTVSPSGNMISHRRVRSASAAHGPSKLSNSVSALTPLEEKNSGVKNAPATQQTGFFSSVFSVAQNAATSFSNSINAQQRNRQTSQNVLSDAEKSLNESTSEEGERNSDNGSRIAEGRPSAVETLGAGDLDFSHLDMDARPAVSRRDDEAAKLEDKRAARAVQVAYARPSDVSLAGPTDDALEIQSTRSLPKDGPIVGDQTPPNGSVVDGDLGGGPKRTGSGRSKLAQRHRGSSGATTSTTGATGAPGGNSSVPRLTGFAVASKKRNRDFHQLFRSVPEDDYLIEDYSCALQREIILAGRIYISEGHICFSSNILGWVTTLVISFDEVVAIEKESTAVVFPNAIAIQTLHARHTFRSLLSRESTYDLMVNIWKINHPTIKSSVNGSRVTNGTGDKTEKVGEEESESESDVTEEDEIYDEDEEGDHAESFFEAGDSANASATSLPVRKGLSRKASNLSANAAVPVAGTNGNGDKKSGDKKNGDKKNSDKKNSDKKNGDKKNGDKKNGDKKNSDKAASTDAPADFPGPATHEATEYGDSNGQYEKVIKEEIISAPLGKVFSLVFGPASGEFMTKFLTDNQKCTELQFEGTAKGLTIEAPTRKYSYIKPLSGSIGPKQTKCISTETMDFLDLEKAVLVTLSTQTPDVPSGNVFATMTKYLFTWAPGNQTRFLMTCTIEWSGKSWLKGPIEKGAIDGQTTFGNEIVKALQIGVVSRGRANGAGRGKDKRKKDEGAGQESPEAATVAVAVDPKVGKEESWGLFEPVRPLLEPFTSILTPLWSSNFALLVIGILFYMAFFRSSPSPSMLSHEVGCPGHGLPQRLAAYEEMWRREETELWNWLEDRVGMDGMVFPNVYRSPEPYSSRRPSRASASDERELAARLREGKISDREMDHALRTTRERLDVLEEMMVKRKARWEAEELVKSEL